MREIVHIIDMLVFVPVFVSVIYLFVFAVLSLKKEKNVYPVARKNHRFVVLFPAYKEDKVIIDSVKSFLKQDYPSTHYDLVVLSDGMKPETNRALSDLPIRLLELKLINSSKAAALNQAVEYLSPSDYEVVVVLDADNTVETDFLERLNSAYDWGVQAMQAHRQAKHRPTEVAILDAVSEEINNAIFRRGHARIGLSSALIGSGMAFDYPWFARHIHEISSMGEDKELELLLLRQGIFIEYLEDVPVYDEKIAGASSFYGQRRRWLAAQFEVLKKGLGYLPEAIVSGNIDYCDKLFQWMLLPRIILLGISFLVAFTLSFVAWALSLKWWLVLFLLLVALSLAMPDELYGREFKRALRKLPILFLLMFLNLFRLRGANRKFIHTQHGNDL